MTQRTIIRTSGAVEEIAGADPLTYAEVADLIGATMLDVVNLRDGRMLFIDESGHPKGLPDNPHGTGLYWSVCRPGTTHRVAGDVVVLSVDQFADADDYL